MTLDCTGLAQIERGEHAVFLHAEPDGSGRPVARDAHFYPRLFARRAARGIGRMLREEEGHGLLCDPGPCMEEHYAGVRRGTGQPAIENGEPETRPIVSRLLCDLYFEPQRHIASPN